MKVLGMDVIAEFRAKHVRAQPYVNAWVAEAKDAAWSSKKDIEAKFRNVDFRPGNRVIFKINGDNYRVDILVHYKANTLLVKRLGSRKEYTAWNWEEALCKR